MGVPGSGTPELSPAPDVTSEGYELGRSGTVGGITPRVGWFVRETLTHVAATEAAGVPFVLATVQLGATVHAEDRKSVV